MPRIGAIDLENEWIGVNQSGDQPWETKRAKIESAIDGRDHRIIQPSLPLCFPRAYLVASMTHRIEAAPGYIRHAGSGVDRPFLLCQLLLRSHGGEW